MVVFLDLEDEAEPPEQGAHWLQHHERGYAGVMRRLDINAVETEGWEDVERENPNKKKPITEALGCYPYVLLHPLICED